MPKTSYHHGDLKHALVQAGIDLLSGEGPAALSLRGVAARAGVSHSAPYAHFTDKQALVAAISTEGFRQLYERLETAAARSTEPARRLVSLSNAYLAFALDHPALFKLMFSGALERGSEYAEFVSMSKQNFTFLVDQVRGCQQAGVLRPGPEEPLAISVWSLVHGFVALLLEDQFSHHTLDRCPPQVLLCSLLNQITMVELSPDMLANP